MDAWKLLYQCDVLTKTHNDVTVCDMRADTYVIPIGAYSGHVLMDILRIRPSYGTYIINHAKDPLYDEAKDILINELKYKPPRVTGVVANDDAFDLTKISNTDANDLRRREMKDRGQIKKNQTEERGKLRKCEVQMRRIALKMSKVSFGQHVKVDDVAIQYDPDSLSDSSVETLDEVATDVQLKDTFKTTPNVQHKDTFKTTPNVQLKDTFKTTPNVQPKDTFKTTPNVQHKDIPKTTPNVQHKDTFKTTPNVQLKDTLKTSPNVQLKDLPKEQQPLINQDSTHIIQVTNYVHSSMEFMVSMLKNVVNSITQGITQNPPAKKQMPHQVDTTILDNIKNKKSLHSPSSLTIQDHEWTQEAMNRFPNIYPPEETLYIYTSPEDTANMLYKVGIVHSRSKSSISNRLGTLNTSKPKGSFVQIWHVYNAKTIESLIHMHFKNIGLHAIKEWIHCVDVETLIDFIDPIVELHNKLYSCAPNMLSMTRERMITNKLAI